MTPNKASAPCEFDKLLTKHVPHILEKIFLSLDYVSFKVSSEVCHSWHQLLNSESIQKKAKLLYTEDTSIHERKLCNSSKEGNTKEVRRLLSSGVNPNCVVYNNDDELDLVLGRQVHIPIICASENGHKYVVELLVDVGADVNATEPTSTGSTALHRASFKGHNEVVKLLLDGGADADIADNCGYTPLILATQAEEKCVIKQLLDAGANPDEVGRASFSPLYWAASGGKTDVVKMLLDAGADPNLVRWSVDSYTELHNAAKKGHRDVVKLLLEAGAEPNLTNIRGESPLHYAACEGHKDIVNILLDGGADPNMATMRGKTPLQMALMSLHLDVVKILIGRGVKPNEKHRGQIMHLEKWQQEVSKTHHK